MSGPVRVIYTIPQRRRLFAELRARQESESWVRGFWAGLLVGLGGAVLAVGLTLFMIGGFCK